jgi:sugar phosphate isomerase/epimerase
MARLKLGICLKSLALPLRRGLEEARKLAVAGVQLEAAGDLAPDRLSQTGRVDLRRLLRTHGLELTALGCPLRRGLDTPDNLEARIDHVKKVMSLSYDLGARCTIVEAGRIPQSAGAVAHFSSPPSLILGTAAGERERQGEGERAGSEDPRLRFLTEALQALAVHGDRVGTALAVETGLESGELLGTFLGRFDTGSLGVNYDPANLLMHGFDPYASMRALRGRVLHAHAKDARAASSSRSAQEVPLGHGDIDWMQLLAGFEEIDYHGWLAVERESGQNRLADVAAGVGFLRRLVG